MSNPTTPYFSPQGAPFTSWPEHVAGLQRHLSECASANGALHGLRCKIEAADAFLGGRFISTVVFAAGLLAISVYW